MATLSVKLKERLNSTSGSASVEFVLLAVPLFLPILIFLNQFETLSNSELIARTLVRESLRAYVTAENPLVAHSRARQVLIKGAEVAGLSSSEIDSLDLDFQCSKFPCLSSGGRVHAILKIRISEPNRLVKAEAEEYISPWQWNGLPILDKPMIKVDL